MGASLSAAEVERNDELVQRHLVRVREAGYTDIEGVDSTIYSLHENHSFQLDATKFIVSHKIFVKREEPDKMRLIEQNLDFINNNISVTAHPYFLLSHNLKFVSPNQKESDKQQDLPILSRQHLRWTLQEKLLSGLSLSYQEKLNIAIQIVISGMVLHEGLNDKADLKLFHANLTSSNILMTSDSIVYFADFAPYKPLYMDYDKFSDNKLFHPNLLERSYIAPEKINSEKASQLYNYEKMDKQTIVEVQQMDIFSIGCILAEIFMSDNNPLFVYETLIKYQQGDKTPLDRINTIPHKEIKEMILKMLSLDPKERGSLKSYLPMFEKCVPKNLLTLYAYLNYVFRRSEFTQPDMKLGLIRLVAPLLLSEMEKELSQAEKESVSSILSGIKFRRCFPYHISKLGILDRLKSIVNGCPLNSFLVKDLLIKFIDETGSDIQTNDLRLEAAKNPISSIYLEGAKYLKETPLDLNQVPYKNDAVFDKEPPKIEFDARKTFTKIITEAKEEHKRNLILQKFSPICQLLETILSLIRNLQLSQSYLVGLELIEILSNFTSSEWITCIILPHLQYRIERQKSDRMEVRFSAKLFCELVSKIKLLKPILAKKSAFMSYIKPFIDTCKEDSTLSLFMIRSLSDFIKINITFMLLEAAFKSSATQGKQNMDVSIISELEVDKVVDEILATPALSNLPNKFSRMFEEKLFIQHIEHALKNEVTSIEILRGLGYIYGYFSPAFVNEVTRLLMTNYGKTTDSGFKNDALCLIASVMHYLPIENVREFITQVRGCKFYAEEYSELASSIKAMSIVLKHKDITFLDKCEILDYTKPFVLCPCSIVHKHTLELIKTVYETSSEEEISMVISPILSHLTGRMPALDFETFELLRYSPLTYDLYQKLLQASKGVASVNMDEVTSKYFEAIQDCIIISKNKANSKLNLISREFLPPKSLPWYIQEVLGCMAIFQIFKTREEAREDRKEIVRRLEKGDQLTKENLLKLFSDKLNDSTGLNFGISIFPRFRNTTDNYERLSNAKEQIIDQLTVKVNYKYIQQFNLSVLKIAMNYIQLLLNLTKLKSVTTRERDFSMMEDDMPTQVNKIKKWRPTGHLCTTINSHEKAVKSLAKLTPQAFASGSHDGHVKLHSLPAVSRNFIHNSVEDIDLNKESSELEPIKVNQVLSLSKISKLAIVNSSNQLFLCNDNKPNRMTKFDCNSRVTSATVYDADEFSNCIGCVTTGCEFLLWDVRQQKPAMQHNLSKIRGVPSAITRIGGQDSDTSSVITTYKGYVVNHDLKTNSTLFTRRLTHEGKPMPIVSVSQFIPATQFPTMPKTQRYILLTYPSKCNQFSVFHLNQNLKNSALPLLMFESGVDSKTSRPTEAPTLEDVTHKEALLDFEGICDERFDYLNKVYMKPDNQFAIGNSFSIRSVYSIGGLYTDNFHSLKLKIKQECLKNFEDVIQMQASIGEYNLTINKVLTLPNFSNTQMKENNLEMDNILLTCGTDKNIRFLNFGNELEKRVLDQFEYEYYNCYHLSNIDNMARSFKFSYARDLYLLKESPIQGQVPQFPMGDILSDGQSPQKFAKNGLSHYHNNFLAVKKNADILPGHSANVNDILFMQNRDTMLVISASDDSLIKVWS